jgi:hypothetical protein
MASCPSCDHAKIKKDRQGLRLCRRCGPLPGSARVAAAALVAASLILSGCAKPHNRMSLIAACRHGHNVYADAAGRWWAGDNDTSPLERIAPGAKLEDICK